MTYVRLDVDSVRIWEEFDKDGLSWHRNSPWRRPVPKPDSLLRKWLKAAVLEEPRYRRSEAPGKLTPFHESLKLALKVDAHRPRHERRTARALHTQIKAEGYGGGCSRVTDFVRAWRQGEGQSISSKAFVPLAFELGEAHLRGRVGVRR